MSDSLTTIEEMNILERLKEPHLSYVIGTLQEKKIISHDILKRKENEILLIASSGFLIDSVFAGLSEKHIEYIAKNAPKNYKENLLKILKDTEMMQEAFEITKAMDENNDNMENQKRIKNVIQYINDNRITFEF